jgi:proteasome accessory factor C
MGPDPRSVVAADRPRTGPRPASERLRRLLVMLPWLMERGEVPLAEMAATFHLTEDQLVKDLELVAMCGLPPFVDELIDVFVDDGMVCAGVPRVFTRPLRLTAPEGFALVAAGRAAAQLPGADPDGALSRALDKVAAALGEPALDVELAAPLHADVLSESARRGAVVRLRYWSPSSDAVTERRVAPRTVFTDRGHWYVLADDLDISGERTFRIDRIEELHPTDETVPVRDVAPPTEWFGAEEEVPTVEIVLSPRSAWVAERYPVTSVEPEAGGGVRVVLPVRSERWLARLLLRLGPDARVTAPDAWAGLALERALSVLALYRVDADGAGESSSSS